MAAKLILSQNGNVISEIPLERTVMTLGRKHANDVHLDNLKVSGAHAKILTVGNDSFLEDLGSTNGTFVNGERIGKTQLSDQDTIEIGEFQLTYVNDIASADSDMEKTIIIQAGSVDVEEAPAPAAKAEAPKADILAAKPAAAPKPKPAAPAPEAGDANVAKLTVVDGPSKGKFITVSRLITRVKGPNGLSCVVSKKEGSYFFLNTITGEHVPLINDAPIIVGSTELVSGDVISFGGHRLKFTAPS